MQASAFVWVRLKLTRQDKSGLQPPFGSVGLDRRFGHLDRSQRKSSRKWLSPWGEMPRLILFDQGIGRKDGQGRSVR